MHGTARDIHLRCRPRARPGLRISACLLIASFVLVAVPAGAQDGPTTLRPRGLERGDHFGAAVAFDGDTAVISSSGDDRNGEEAGVAYVYRHGGDGWRREATLAPRGATASEGFGFAVAIDGAVAVVSAVQPDDRSDPGGRWSSTFVFERRNGSWEQRARLVPLDPHSSDGFGMALAVERDVIAVGRHRDNWEYSSGEVYLYRRTAGRWELERILTPPDGMDRGFGAALALSGDRLIVGAPDAHDPCRPFAGAAIIYEGAPGWRLRATLFDPDPAEPPHDQPAGDFGRAVSLRGDRALVGGSSDGRGRVVEFQEVDSGAWDPKTIIDGPGRDPGFGSTLALRGRTLVIGNPSTELNDEAAAVTLLRRRDAGWRAVGALRPARRSSFAFGTAVALGRAVTLIGDPLQTGAGVVRVLRTADAGRTRADVRVSAPERCLLRPTGAPCGPSVTHGAPAVCAGGLCTGRCRLASV